MLIYRNGDCLANLKPWDYIVHSCNAEGVWGAGFAAQLKYRFPSAYDQYRSKANGALLGGYIYSETSVSSEIIINNLIVSSSFGQNISPPDQILKYTQSSVDTLIINNANNLSKITFKSPLINSGLFKVPWVKTEKILIDSISEFNKVYDVKIRWEVYVL